MYTPFTWVVGVDEAGRGSLAGPVSVGVVCVRVSDIYNVSEMMNMMCDSKAVTEKKRERLFGVIESSEVTYGYGTTNVATIERIGIVRAIEQAVQKALQKVPCEPNQTLLLLDGGLKAPKKFRHQHARFHGDALEPIIGAASIVAKVLRDRSMRRLARTLPQYGFERHKGYGTKEHYRMIGIHNVSTAHRVSWIVKEGKPLVF